MNFKCLLYDVVYLIYGMLNLLLILVYNYLLFIMLNLKCVYWYWLMVFYFEFFCLERYFMLVLFDDEWYVFFWSKCFLSCYVVLFDVKIDYLFGNDFDNLLLIFYLLI